MSRRQQSTRRSAGPQFANSPRFLLSQTTPQRKDDIDIDDGDGPPSASARTPAPSRNVIPPRWQKDVIEDSDDGELARDTGTREAEGNELIDDAIDSSLPEEAASPGGLDTVFAPARDSHKRRRLSAGLNQSFDEKWKQDNSVPPLSPELQEAAPDPLRTPGNMKTPFRSKPRFMLSTKKHVSSQTPFRAETPFATRPTSPPERRKPAFVLPRELSPDRAAEDIPTPFSPSSRTLRRRGRARAGVPGYTPGGMAAEVRSWILEMGSKRENIASARSSETSNTLSKYVVTARVVNVSLGTLSSSGPVALIQAETTRPSQEGEEHESLNIVAMGLPRSRPNSRQASHTGEFQALPVQAGDLVGIHRGLAWDLELHDFQALSAIHGLSLESNELSDTRQRWLVAMEWDIMSEGP